MRRPLICLVRTVDQSRRVVGWIDGRLAALRRCVVARIARDRLRDR
jgi:hypothetical protein